MARSSGVDEVEVRPCSSTDMARLERLGEPARRMAHHRERWTASGGAVQVGLAYEPGNDGAQRLYERLGYGDWGHGMVLDEWTERDEDGQVVYQHRTPCGYLVKSLG